MLEGKGKILDTVSMLDVFEHYGFELNRSGFTCCMFHSEKTPSMKLYKENKRYHCFGCGADGNVIDFVMTYFKLDFSQAMARIDYDFSVGISSENPTNRQRIELIEQRNKRRKETKATKKKRQDKLDLYGRELEEFIRLDRNFKAYKPIGEEDELHPFFVESLHKIEYQWYRLGLCKREI